MRRRSQARADSPALTQDEILRSCEKSDRILRAVLGETADRTVLRFAPVLVLLLVVAGIASFAGW